MIRTAMALAIAILSGAAIAQAPVGSIAGTASGGVGAAVGSTVNGGRTSTMPAAPRGSSANTNAAAGARVDSSISSTRPVQSTTRQRTQAGVNTGLNVQGTTPRRGADTSVDADVNGNAVTDTTRSPPR